MARELKGAAYTIISRREVFKPLNLPPWPHTWFNLFFCDSVGRPSGRALLRILVIFITDSYIEYKKINTKIWKPNTQMLQTWSSADVGPKKSPAPSPVDAPPTPPPSLSRYANRLTIQRTADEVCSTGCVCVARLPRHTLKSRGTAPKSHIAMSWCSNQHCNRLTCVRRIIQHSTRTVSSHHQLQFLAIIGIIFFSSSSVQSVDYSSASEWVHSKFCVRSSCLELVCKYVLPRV